MAYEEESVRSGLIDEIANLGSISFSSRRSDADSVDPGWGGGHQRDLAVAQFTLGLAMVGDPSFPIKAELGAGKLQPSRIKRAFRAWGNKAQLMRDQNDLVFAMDHIKSSLDKFVPPADKSKHYETYDGTFEGVARSPGKRLADLFFHLEKRLAIDDYKGTFVDNVHSFMSSFARDIVMSMAFDSDWKNVERNFGRTPDYMFELFQNVALRSPEERLEDLEKSDWRGMQQFKFARLLDGDMRKMLHELFGKDGRQYRVKKVHRARMRQLREACDNFERKQGFFSQVLFPFFNSCMFRTCRDDDALSWIPAEDRASSQAETMLQDALCNRLGGAIYYNNFMFAILERTHQLDRDLGALKIEMQNAISTAQGMEAKALSLFASALIAFFGIIARLLSVYLQHKFLPEL